MDEIFLQDYANNVAQAQDPFGIAAVQSQPGFENYTPSTQGIEPIAANQPMGLVQDPTPVDYKGMIKEGLKNVGTNYVIDKLGLEGIKRNVVGSMIGTNALSFSNPLGMAITAGTMMSGSTFPDAVKGIAGMLRGKRLAKNIQKNVDNDKQGDITTYNMKTATMQPTPQDLGRGQNNDGGSAPKTSAPAPSTPSHQTSGPGGLHSY